MIEIPLQPSFVNLSLRMLVLPPVLGGVLYCMHFKIRLLEYGPRNGNLKLGEMDAELSVMGICNGTL